MKRLHIVAVAASTRKMGMVYLRGGDLLDWGFSAKATQSIDAAFAQMTAWLNRYHPDVVLVEYLDQSSRKGVHTRAIVEAVLAAARERNIAWERVVRPRRFANKYKQAALLAEEFPQLAPWLPRPRRLYDREPENIIYFEALALATEWMARTGQNGF